MDRPEDLAERDDARDESAKGDGDGEAAVERSARASSIQLAYLIRGLGQPGGKLPLFDRQGQHYSDRTVKSCIEQGWAEPWIRNPIKPDWIVCRLTEAGRSLAENNLAQAEIVTLDIFRDAKKAS